MTLEIVAEARVPTGVRPTLRRVLKRLMREYAVASGVCVVLTVDARLRALKKEFWGEDVATDVLSFPQWEPGDPFVPSVLGDIVISVDTAARQAEERGHDLSTEIAVLASHGLLHLLGHDHQTPEAWEPFHAIERCTLELLKQP